MKKTLILSLVVLSSVLFLWWCWNKEKVEEVKVAEKVTEVTNNVTEKKEETNVETPACEGTSCEVDTKEVVKPSTMPNEYSMVVAMETLVNKEKTSTEVNIYKKGENTAFVYSKGQVWPFPWTEILAGYQLGKTAYTCLSFQWKTVCLEEEGATNMGDLFDFNWLTEELKNYPDNKDETLFGEKMKCYYQETETQSDKICVDAKEKFRYGENKDKAWQWEIKIEMKNFKEKVDNDKVFELIGEKKDIQEFFTENMDLFVPKEETTSEVVPNSVTPETNNKPVETTPTTPAE